MARGRNFVFALGRTPLRPQGHVCDQIRSLAHEFPVAEATTMWEICFVDQGEPLVSIVCVLSPLECHYSSCNFLPQARDAFGSKFAQKVAPTDQKGVRVCWLGGGRGLGGGGSWGVAGCTTPHVVITARARAMQNGFLNTQKTAKTSIPRRCVPAACPRRWYRG